MKKLLIILMSVVLFVCCSDDNENTGGFENQEISLSAEAIVLDMNGNASSGSTNAVTITSTADWRLTGDVSWCTPSVSKGSTGTTVTFTAAENNTDDNREVNLFFICGNAARKLTVKQFPEEIVEFSNLKDSYTMTTAGGRITVMVNTNLDVFNTEISEDWVSLRAEKDDSKSKWVQFIFDANETFSDRDVTITMFKGTASEKIFTVTQSKFTGVIINGIASHEFGVNGGTVTVSASANVNFSPSITAANTVWISAVETSSSGTDIITKTFDITCAPSEFSRSGVVTLSPVSGTAATISISQENPNPELFGIPDDIFANRLVALGYLGAKDNKYYITYPGYTATSISITGSAFSGMTSVEGVERFINLTSFRNEDNLVRKVDVSRNTKITSLSLNYFPLEELIMGDINVTSFTANNYLYAYYNNTNRAQSFKISSSKLRSLTINHTSTSAYDEMEWIDITGCPALTSLSANRNSGKLKYIYVTQAQKNAYDAGTLKITTNANFSGSIVVK